MIFAVIFTSILIGACGYIVNEDNADLLLSGYNTMSKDEKSKFDLSSYLGFLENSCLIFPFILLLYISFPQYF